ncbi:MAG TPA: response regulator [Verrucomicrobiae bacterium]|jgi:CheY-like chemotaxis protein|nr:response regulator [Verrucomicrobiae bacterium]
MNLKGKKILFVDDEPTIVKIMMNRLKSHSFVVETALNGKEALEKAKTFQPDLILLDVSMPGMDGYEVCQLLKKDHATAHVPVIMFTASQAEDFLTKGLRAGAEDVINKPFVADLLESIKGAFNGKKEDEV